MGQEKITIIKIIYIIIIVLSIYFSSKKFDKAYKNVIPRNHLKNI